MALRLRASHETRDSPQVVSRPTPRHRLAAAAAALALTAASAGLVGWSAAEEASPPAKKAAAEQPAPSAGDVPEDDPLGPNAACYVCHMTFIKEELAEVHLKQKVGCVTCHGLSAKHANDEDIGASKPDICYPRDKVDANCLECHPEHNVPARKVMAQFFQRKLAPQHTVVCTDCHGTHAIQRAANGTQ